ncbi:ACT domain-containing protein [Nocardiopsis sp. RV163]|uniref:ACT domain-containing protein n=1 Tax=Nocardiopsis sp. RV163 TaxID=1661388 RepID=UPI00064B9346|nr:ACT domain-containing protein [Nocardiopsis sp. RV163]
MAGELERLLAGTRVRTRSGVYVFTTVPDRASLPEGVRPVATVVEDEALTVVCPRQEADAAGLPYDGAAAWITLEAPAGAREAALVAAVAAALTGAGLPCDVVSGFHHDHVFVPEEAEERAVAVLRALLGSEED